MKNSVQIMSVELKRGVGYDVQVQSTQATVQDYLDTLNQYIEAGTFTRTRSETAICKGCDCCCHERIPLTLVDVLRLRKAVNSESSTISPTVAQYCHVAVEGAAVDIALAGGVDGQCIFLGEDTGCCQIYNYRPMVCQTYICCPATQRAKALRSLIVNLGEDELVRYWLAEIEAGQGQLVLHEAYEPNINPQDWIQNLFTGVTDYNQLKLKDICPDELWQSLYCGA